VSQKSSTQNSRDAVYNIEQVCPARWADTVTMVCGTKVLCPQNLFSRKAQRYKGRMSRYVDIRHLCFWQNTGTYYN